MITSTQLTEHFKLEEFTRSATAIRHGWDNTPTQAEIDNLQRLCENILEPLRRRFGVIRITSGYRSKQLNKAVGGAERSRHLYGEAADVFIPNAEVGKKMYLFLRSLEDYDQVIYEVDPNSRRQWLHISYRSVEPNRHEAFMYYHMEKKRG